MTDKRRISENILDGSLRMVYEYIATNMALRLL